MLQNFFIAILASLYSVVGNLGLSIILLTLLIRTGLLPLTLPSLKARKKIKKLQPKLDKLKKKHKGDKLALQKAQTDLYKKYNVNPLGGCIPQLIQLVMLIGLYRAMQSFLEQTEVMGMSIDPTFLWMNLAESDSSYILPIIVFVVQMIYALMISPGAEVRDIVPNESKSKKVQKENEKEEDMAEMAKSMQQQMLFIMPISTAFLALKFPSGLALYWATTNLFNIIQQYAVSGWGGLIVYWQKLKLAVTKLLSN